MENEIIGASIQVASFLMSILGVTLQRRAMIVEDEGSEEGDETSSLLYVPDSDADDLDYDEEANLQESLVSTGTISEEDGSSMVLVQASGIPKSLSQEDTQLAIEHGKRGRWCYHRLCKRCTHVSKMWLFGFCIFYLSQVVEIFALNFASQSTIVAVGSLSTFVNAIVAVRVFHESFQFVLPRGPSLRQRLFRWDLLNLIIIVSGGVCTVIFAPRIPDEEEKSFNAEKLLHKWIEMPFLVFFVTGIVVVTVLMSRFFLYNRGPLTLAIILGTLNSFSITMSKIVTQLVNRNDLFNTRSLVMLLLWVMLLLTQIVLLQIGLRNFEQSGAFSIGGVLGGALTIICGMLYYQTYNHFSSDGAVYGFVFGVLMMLYGILVFSQRKNLSRQEMKRRLLADTVVLDEEATTDALRDAHSSLVEELLRNSSASSSNPAPASPNGLTTVYKTIETMTPRKHYHGIDDEDGL